jgi:hypothetical protein
MLVPRMAKAPTTLPTGEDARAFIAAVPDEARRQDAQKLCRLLSDWTRQPPVMWGASTSITRCCERWSSVPFERTVAPIGRPQMREKRRVDADGRTALDAVPSRSVVTVSG